MCGFHSLQRTRTSQESQPTRDRRRFYQRKTVTIMEITEGSFSARSGSGADALGDRRPTTASRFASTAGTSGASASQLAVSGAFVLHPPGPDTARHRPAVHHSSRHQVAASRPGAMVSLHRQAVLGASRARPESIPVAALAAAQTTEQSPADPSAVPATWARATCGLASTRTIEKAPEQVTEQAPAISSPTPVPPVQAAAGISSAQLVQLVPGSTPPCPATLATATQILPGRDRRPSTSGVSDINSTAINPATYKPFGFIPYGWGSHVPFSHTGGFTGVHVCSLGFRHDIQEYHTYMGVAVPYADDGHNTAYSDPLVYEVPRTTLSQNDTCPGTGVVPVPAGARDAAEDGEKGNEKLGS